MYIRHQATTVVLFHHIGAVVEQNGEVLADIGTRVADPMLLIPGPDGLALEWRSVFVIPVEAADEQAVAEWLIGVDGFYAGGEIVSDEQVAIEGERDRLARLTKEKRDEVERGGVVIAPFGTFDTDPDSQRKIGGAVTMALLATINSQSFGIDWRLADNTIVALDAAGMIAVGLAVGQHVNACQQRKNALDASLAAAASLEDFEAIDIETGWPE